MNFTFSILISLLALESVVAAPAPPSGSIIDSSSPSPSARTKNCKALRGPPAEWAQGFGRHRRPGPRPSAAPATSQSADVPASSPSSGSDGTESSAQFSEAVPTSSEIASPVPPEIASPSSSQVEEPSSTQETLLASPTAIQAGQNGEIQQGGDAGENNAGGNGGEQNSGQTSSAAANQPITTGSTGNNSGENEGSGAPAGFEADILNAHNVFRATYGAQPLVWNQTLADQGNNYWKDRNCEFAHSNLGNGENLTGGGGKFTGQGVFDGWAVEAGDWSPGTGFTLDTGHFTQVVWKETTSLGCGLFVCGAKSLAFCEYQKPGNAGSGTDFDQQVVKS